MGNSYIDVCAYFVKRRLLYNLNISSIPFYKTHTGLSKFEFLCKIFDVLSHNSGNQLIGASSNITQNIIDHIAAVITCLQKCLLEGFFVCVYFIN